MKKGVTIDKYGQPILDSENIRTLILQGKNINHTCVDQSEEIALFQKYQSHLIDHNIFFQSQIDDGISFDEFHNLRSSEWIFPESYQKINVLEFLLEKCKTQKEKDRVIEEYALFEEQELIMILRLFIFLVDYMRKNNFMWGVGRGSSVSSYILYLIGIHKVDSLFYELDIHDYLK